MLEKKTLASAMFLDKWLWVKSNGIPFWGRCATPFRTYFSGDWDVHWVRFGFDPWPNWALCAAFGQVLVPAEWVKHTHRDTA